MRIVDNLENTIKCPNCGEHCLIKAINDFGRIYKVCYNCQEEIFENEDTEYAEKEEAERKRKKEQLIFDLREDVCYLAQNVHDVHSMTLVNNLREIFNKIIDYIEEN